MTRDIILKAIANDKDVKTACANICRGKDSKEFYQHIMLCVCEIEESKLIDIYKNGHLRWYIVKIIMYQWADWLKVKSKVEYIDSITDIQDEPYNYELDIEVSRVEDNINNLPVFEKRMLLEYIKSGSYRKLSEETQIPYRTIGNHVKRIKDKLNENIRS